MYKSCVNMNLPIVKTMSSQLTSLKCLKGPLIMSSTLSGHSGISIIYVPNKYNNIIMSWLPLLHLFSSKVLN